MTAIWRPGGDGSIGQKPLDGPAQRWVCDQHETAPNPRWLPAASQPAQQTAREGVKVPTGKKVTGTVADISSVPTSQVKLSVLPWSCAKQESRRGLPSDSPTARLSPVEIVRELPSTCCSRLSARRARAKNSAPSEAVQPRGLARIARETERRRRRPTPLPTVLGRWSHDDMTAAELASQTFCLPVS